MAKRARVYCSLYGCMNSSSSKPELTFFKLPTETARLSQWLRVMCREDLANRQNITGSRVCEEHFNVQDVLPNASRKVLKKNAVPTLNLPDAILLLAQETYQTENKDTQTFILRQEKYTQTTQPIKVKLPRKTPRRRNLRSSTTSKRREAEDTLAADVNALHALCDKLLTKELANQVKEQANSKLLRK